MSYGSVKLMHQNGKMHHLGVDETQIAKSVILTPDPLEIPKLAAFMDNAEKVGDFREYVSYTGEYKGKPLTVMSCGFGCMPMSIAIEELNHLGAERVVKIAAAPAIQPETKVGSLFAASGAVRGEGSTREYIDISYPAVANSELLSGLIAAGVKNIGLFRSHDCQNLETPYTEEGKARLAKWEKLGVEVIDGETSAMFVVGSILGVKTASLALITENYATGEKLADSTEGMKKLFETAAEVI